jgi:hypothetical protein
MSTDAYNYCKSRGEKFSGECRQIQESMAKAESERDRRRGAAMNRMANEADRRAQNAEMQGRWNGSSALTNAATKIYNLPSNASGLQAARDILSNAKEIERKNYNHSVGIANPLIRAMHSGGNVLRTGVYRVLSCEIVIPAKFRKGLGHKRIVDLIAKKHQGPIPRTVKVGDSRGGRISKNGPMRLLKGDVVISRGQRKGLTFGQIINLIHG